MKLLFFHGWGFDAGFWTGVIKNLQEYEASCDDRGYFGLAPVPTSLPSEPFVVIAHSFGTMRALAALGGGCQGIVAINGFDAFTPGVPVRVIERMISRFGQEPATVLADFRYRCGDESTFGPLATIPLADDLQIMRNASYSVSWRMPVLSLQGEVDPLLPAAMRESVFASSAEVDRINHPAGGHLLPLSHPVWCANAIRAFIDRVT